MFFTKKFVFIILFITILIKPVFAESVSVLTWNIGDSDKKNPSCQEISEVILKQDKKPGILILQEVSLKKLKLLNQKLNYKYYAHSYSQHNKIKNIGILTNYKIVDTQVLNFSENSSGALKAIIETSKGNLSVICVHFDYIKAKKRSENGYVKMSLKEIFHVLKNEIFYNNTRKEEAGKLINWIGKNNSQTIIAGDFNTISFSSGIRKIRKYYKDSISSLKNIFSLSGTYKKINFPISPRIDFIFYSKDLKLKSSQIIKETPGDHYPVSAVIEL